MNANASDRKSGAFLFVRHESHEFVRMAEKLESLASVTIPEFVSIREISV